MHECKGNINLKHAAVHAGDEIGSIASGDGCATDTHRFVFRIIDGHSHVVSRPLSHIGWAVNSGFMNSTAVLLAY